MPRMQTLSILLIGFLLMSTIAPLSGNPFTGLAGHAHAEDAVSEEEGHEHDYVPVIDDKGNIIWTCSMHPQIRLPEPGKCPICFMDLIPIEVKPGGERFSLRQVNFSRAARKLAEITTTEVVRQPISVNRRLVGKVDYDETRQGTITAWVSGRIDRLHVDYTGSMVRRGQPMAAIYSPELLTAQAELIQAGKALKAAEAGNVPLVRETAGRTLEAAREKLRLLGLTKPQIDTVATTGKTSEHITLYAPQSGVVISKEVVEGMYVKTGAPLFTIADLSRVWVILEAYESDLAWIREGQPVAVEAEAFPGDVFTGKVVYIDPVVNERTRTVRVRLEVGNKRLRLKPGMFVRAVQEARAGKLDADAPLVIPASAPLITGKRAVVYVSVPDKEGVYVGREVVLGPRAGDFYIVKSGLREGEMVVTKGNFKIDSAIQIVAGPSMMNPSGGASPGGHAHGPESGHGGDDGHAAHEQSKRSGLPASPLFFSKLRNLEIVFAAMAAHLSREDLDGYRASAVRLREALGSINADSLEGESGLVWRELAMLMTNDAVLAAEARNLKRARAIHKEAAAHFIHVGMSFDYREKQGSTLAATVSREFKMRFGDTFRFYSQLTEALSGDDIGVAMNAAKALHGKLVAVGDIPLGEFQAKAWTVSLERMNHGLAEIFRAGDIEEVRTGFRSVSIGYIAAVRSLGIETGKPLFILNCPMAFDGEGGDWLQPDEEVRNPYFGEVMYRCGEATEQLKGG